MSAMLDYMQLCRLCLVKEKVNVPIFGDETDVRQIFLKITACLPVKVAQEDNLPKKICDACLYKVDLLYQFWNTTVNAEKQLIQWLTEIGVDVNIKNSDTQTLPILPQSHAHPHSIPVPVVPITDLKQEQTDIVEKPGFQMPDQPNMYSSYDNLGYPQPEVTMEVGAANAFVQPEPAEEPPPPDPPAPVPKKRGRPAGATNKKSTPKKKPTPAPPVVVSPRTNSTRRSSATAAAAAVAAAAAAATDSEEDSDGDRLGGMDDYDDSDSDEDHITKEEIDSDEDYVKPKSFLGVPSSADGEQPGPSGLGGIKGEATGANATESGCNNNNNSIYGDSAFPFPVVWVNNNDESEKIEIKVEPIDFDWNDEISLMDLRIKRKLKKRAKKPKKVPRSQKQPCVICNNIIRGRSAMINHYLNHKEEKINSNLEAIKQFGEEDFFRCCICMKEFVTKAKLDKHSDYHVQRPFFCELCNKSFKQTQNFLLHMESHQSNNVMKCDSCDFSTTFKLAFDQHAKSHLRQEYKCKECDKVFSARTWFLEHRNFHTGEKPFSCEECGKCFPYSRYLAAHKKSMHPHCFFKEPALNECTICKKRYSHKNSLRLHMKSHTGENTYLCDICGKKLSSTDKLQLHRRIHTGFKPYKCTVCEKRFTKKDILTDHLRVHSGEKPFACETCGKCFSQRSPLTIHRRYHTGERPYVCHLCNKGFVSKGILGIHLKQGKH